MHNMKPANKYLYKSKELQDYTGYDESPSTSLPTWVNTEDEMAFSAVHETGYKIFHYLQSNGLMSSFMDHHQYDYAGLMNDGYLNDFILNYYTSIYTYPVAKGYNVSTVDAYRRS